MGKEDEEMSEEVCPYHDWRLKDNCSACKDGELTYFNFLYQRKNETKDEEMTDNYADLLKRYDVLYQKCERYRQALLKISGRVGMRMDEIRFSNPDQLHSFAEAYKSIAEKALDE